jgi:hypothetical protein
VALTEPSDKVIDFDNPSKRERSTHGSFVSAIFIIMIISTWILSIYLWLYNPRGLFQFLNLYTVGRTPWMGDQPVTRQLPKHRTTQAQNASSGIRTHDSSVRTGEDDSCLRPRGGCDLQVHGYCTFNFPSFVVPALHVK